MSAAPQLDVEAPRAQSQSGRSTSRVQTTKSGAFAANDPRNPKPVSGSRSPQNTLRNSSTRQLPSSQERSRGRRLRSAQTTALATTKRRAETEKARSANMSRSGYVAARDMKKAELLAQQEKVRGASFVPLILMSAAHLFGYFVSFVEVLGPPGIAISLVFSAYMIIIALICMIYQEAISPISSTGRFVIRIVLVVLALFINSLMFIIKYVIPLSLLIDAVVIMLYKIDLWREGKRIEEELAQL